MPPDTWSDVCIHLLPMTLCDMCPVTPRWSCWFQQIPKWASCLHKAFDCSQIWSRLGLVSSARTCPCTCISGKVGMATYKLSLPLPVAAKLTQV